jgi:hypothetical protein
MNISYCFIERKKMLKKILFVSLMLATLSITSHAEFALLSLADFYKMVEISPYANKKETIVIAANENIFSVIFELDHCNYIGGLSLPAIKNQRFELYMRKEQNIRDRTELGFETSFAIWKEDEQIELRFERDGMNLNTTVRLYPIEQIDSSLDDKDYVDGLPDLVSFLSNEKATYKGIKFSDLLAKKDDFNFLERSHDYIQQLFPTTEKGAAIAHLLNDDVIRRFSTQPRLKKNILKSFDMMLNFYGFHRVKSRNVDLCSIVQNENFDERADQWITKGNHNYLRITRILNSLKLLGLKKEAQSFLDALNAIEPARKKCIGKKSYDFWFKALDLPIIDDQDGVFDLDKNTDPLPKSNIIGSAFEPESENMGESFSENFTAGNFIQF